jgi:hypothetical protein
LRFARGETQRALVHNNARSAINRKPTTRAQREVTALSR